jgi:hypothetical protein
MVSEDGYCLLYPARMRPTFVNATDSTTGSGLITLHGTKPLALSIEATPAKGRSLDQAVGDVLSGYQAGRTAQIKQTSARLGGEPAVILDGLPGQFANRQALVIHGDRIYQLVLLPYGDQALPELQAEAQILWNMVTGSLAFIPVIQPATTPLARAAARGATATAPAASALPSAPASLRVAYSDGETLWLWQSNGRRTRLTAASPTSDVRISSDGRIIAFSRDQELWAIHSDGSGEQRLVSLADFRGMAPRDPGVGLGQFGWLTGTHTLLFNTVVLPPPGQPQNTGPADDLRSVDADSGRLSSWLPQGQGGNFLPSPDGQQIALITPEQISVVRRDGTGRRELLSYGPILTYAGGAYYAQPAWAADGRSLRVAIPPQDWLPDDHGPTTVWSVPTDGDGGAPVAVAHVKSELQRAAVLVSPDLTRILYARRTQPGAVPGDAQITGEIHIARIDGSGDVVAHSGSFSGLGWAPDGRHFLVQPAEPNQPPELWDSAGQRSAPLTDRPGRPSWVTAIEFLLLTPSSGDWRYAEESELRFGAVGQPSLLLAQRVVRFDFVVVRVAEGV